MSLMWLVYFAEIVENLSVFLISTGLVGLFICLIVLIIHNVEFHKSEDTKKVNKISMFAVPFLLFLLLIAALLPSEKTIYLMAAAYGTEQVIKNERVQTIGNDVLDVIEIKLKEMKEEGK